MEMNMGHKNGSQYIMGTRAEVDRDLLINCNLGVIELIQSGLGKY